MADDVKQEPQQTGGTFYLNLMATVQNALKRQREAEPSDQDGAGDAKRPKTQPEPATEPALFDIGSMLESALVSYDAQQGRSTPNAEGTIAPSSDSPRPSLSAPTASAAPQDRKKTSSGVRQDFDYVMRFVRLPSLGSAVGDASGGAPGSRC